MGVDCCAKRMRLNEREFCKCSCSTTVGGGMFSPSSGTVIFNVCGSYFEVLRQTIEGKPSTMLACLLDDVGTDSSVPIFVDANPDRFSYILDWYRFGEMHIPRDLPVDAILCDARYFLLPNTVKINGASYTLRSGTADVACDKAIEKVVNEWPTFQYFIEDLINKVQKTFDSIAQTSSEVHSDVQQCSQEGLLMSTLPRERIILSRLNSSTGRHMWLDQKNICNKERLRIVLNELEKRGFDCVLERGGFDWSKAPLALNIGLREHGGWNSSHNSPGPLRVRLAGVEVTHGRLLVSN
eukprot:TRINITY_DN31505_c0_g1_i1.p1 TRINITY_DN31505_c0_g1~~TRINITY_DN31505_c0_g1_i1.p1  ORF type:complete len:314 (+),score=22.50 TRINITY_DN31505_c0_g1_i1:55-942(+)